MTKARWTMARWTMARWTLPHRPDARAVVLAMAFVLAIAAILAPRLQSRNEAYRLLAIVDVTGSMNVRDYDRGGRPLSRLEAAKSALRTLAAQLPCGSQLGLGIFTERRSFLLFEPIDTCADFAPLDGAISALDWRMAWEGDSYVAQGLYSGINLAAGLNADLIFLTDGQEAPPLPRSGIPPFTGEMGKVRGLIVGVGGATPVPIPRFDTFGREVGFYGPTDVPQENRSGPPPEGAEAREGWHPRNAPWGAELSGGEEHMSAVRTEHLEALAARTGLSYAALTSTPLEGAVAAAARPRPVPGHRDTAPVPAALALLLLVGLYAAPLIRSVRYKRIATP
ncbi:vWA domain-containing protein [Xanthobacter agilis]|uniref:vWA domain-containing protein n=1 Tax=Xanthobacter agilis TaxID=47492 RepID=UPI0037277E9C